MIVQLSGTLLDSLPNQLILDVQGVGYQVHIPVSTYDKLNPTINSKITLYTHLHIRETAHTLYGFATLEEKNIFLLLIERVGGIGPAIAMAVLSGMQVEQFKAAVANGEVNLLTKVKGLGKKTAERIVLELRDKVGVVDAWKAASAGLVSTAANDAELALISLGYKQVEARKAIKAAQGANADSDTETLIKTALRVLNS